jgi:hypothetical protein
MPAAAADTAAVGTVAADTAAVECIPPRRRILAGRAAAARILRLIQSEAAVSPGVRHVPAGRASAARATGSPTRRPTRSGVPRHARGIRVAGCSATAPSPTWHCDRNSGRRDSTAGSSVPAGLGGAAVSSSAGSDHCSGPTPIMTCSITFTGRMPMTTFGRMPTTTSTTAFTAITPISRPNRARVGTA